MSHPQTTAGVSADGTPCLEVGPAIFAYDGSDLAAFAIVELMRAVAAFLIAPIFAHFAVNVDGGFDHGVGIVLWIGFALALLGGIVPVVLYWLGGARAETPDIEGFLAGEGPAYESPPLLARLRNLSGRGHAVTQGAD
jgi:hypothetical protein